MAATASAGEASWHVVVVGSMPPRCLSTLLPSFHLSSTAAAATVVVVVVVVSSSLGHPRKIMAPDKTRGTLSKGAYIYETFGKQMDKSNITEAERDQAP